MTRLLYCFPFLSLIFLMTFLSACSQQKLSSFGKTKPVFSLIEFFEGETLAYGIFEDRFGNLKRRFKRICLKGTLRNLSKGNSKKKHKNEF